MEVEEKGVFIPISNFILTSKFMSLAKGLIDITSLIGDLKIRNSFTKLMMGYNKFRIDFRIILHICHYMIAYVHNIII